jgi:uncharacterized membrane protein YgdD (TMEM256/DUF423 family)
MNRTTTLLCASIMGGLAVVIGAFGAHAFKPLLIEAGRTETFELAVRYQFYHALALLGTGILMAHSPSRLLSTSALCFLFGIFFFSGSLYVLCFTGLKVLGAVTPFGGLFFIGGWLLLALGTYKSGKAS